MRRGSDAFAPTSPSSAYASPTPQPSAAPDFGFAADFDPDFGAEPAATQEAPPQQEAVLPAPVPSAATPAPAPAPAPAQMTQPTIERESSEDEQDDAAIALAIAGGGATTPGGSAVMMAQPVPAGEGELPTGGVGVAVPFDSIAAEYSVAWIREDGEQLPATLDVSIEGVRVVLDADRRTVVLFADYYHIKSWDVSQQKFGLKLMEQPPQGGGSIELSFSFLTVEARVIAGAVKAQVDQLILEKQNGKSPRYRWHLGCILLKI